MISIPRIAHFLILFSNIFLWQNNAACLDGVVEGSLVLDVLSVHIRALEVNIIIFDHHGEEDQPDLTEQEAHQLAALDAVYQTRAAEVVCEVDAGSRPHQGSDDGHVADISEDQSRCQNNNSQYLVSSPGLTM